MENINRQSAAKQILTKPIKGWEDKYTISTDGKVYSLRTNKILKPRLSLDGYERVCLCNGPIKRECRVHRLVAETFIENPNNLPQVNHKDFNTVNNYIENLEWCNNYQNSHYSIENNRNGFGNQISNRGKDGQFKFCKSYTFTNIYNNKSFIIIGIKNVAKQFGCSLKLFNQIIYKYSNTGMYVKQGYFKGLKIDSEYLKVQRLVDNDVDSSESKCETPSSGEDIV